MTKPTYTEFKAEQSEADRRKCLEALLVTEKSVEKFVAALAARAAEDEAEVERLVANVAKRKLHRTEVTANLDTFLKDLSKVAEQEVITNDDLQALNVKLADAKLTAEDREQSTRTVTPQPVSTLNTRAQAASARTHTWFDYYDDARSNGYSDPEAHTYANQMYNTSRKPTKF